MVNLTVLVLCVVLMVYGVAFVPKGEDGDSLRLPVSIVLPHCYSIPFPAVFVHKKYK